ncbi:hypothetical protein D3C72_2063890 [compost metagenome]
MSKNRRPRKPLLPVSTRTEIDPLVIPLFGIWMTSVVMHFPRREQQNIPWPTDKLPIVIVDHPFATHGDIQNVPLHSQRSIDKKVEITVGFNGGQTRDQMGVEGVTRQQGIVLYFGHKLVTPNGQEGNKLSISRKAV